MNNPTLQADWDALRLTLFRDVAETKHVNGEEWNNFLDVLTTAFDYKAPIYTIYRPLRTFAVARWPLLKPLCTNKTILREVTEILHHSVVQQETANADSLETEMEILRQLLNEDHT